VIAMLLRAMFAWFGLMLLAVLNGAFREAVLTPRTDADVAHVMSTFLLILVIAVFTWLVIRWLGPRSAGDALRVGFLWLMLTLAFEFGFGRFVAGRSWAELLAEYNILAGRVWALVPIVVFLAPYAAGRLRRLH
jgi:hypothetical protein